MNRGLLVLPLVASLVLPACLGFGGPSGPTPTLAPLKTLVGNSENIEDLEEMRRLAFAYWEAFIAYDPDTTLSYLEENYLTEREETVRSEIGRIKRFKVKLQVTEESPPQLIGTDEGEMFLRMREPLGTRSIRMAFRKLEGQWKITFAQEVE